MADPKLRVAAALCLGLTLGCGDEARRNLAQAAQSLDEAGDEVQAAAVQSAEELDDKAEVATDKLRAAKKVADRAGDAYLESGSGVGESVVKRSEAVRCANESYEVDRAYVKTALASPLTAAGKSSFDPPTAAGLRVGKVDPQSPLQALDVREGDVLVEVNGQSLNSLDAMELVSDLETASTATATVERDGARITKTIHIVGGA